jgi:molybdopterin synthase catalytic subunit
MDTAIEITFEPLEVERVLAQVERPEAGAVSLFVGNVRANSRGRRIAYLEYTAYEPMARRELENIAAQVLARDESGELRCAIAHRLGRLGIGEASVIIAVSSPHRVAAMEACAWAIEELKRRVPIWKQEWTPEGFWWVEDPANPLADLSLRADERAQM